jgi:hypothetical protein
VFTEFVALDEPFLCEFPHSQLQVPLSLLEQDFSALLPAIVAEFTLVDNGSVVCHASIPPILFPIVSQSIV